jgi:hypothetical protein
MSEIGKRLAKLNANGKLSATEKELIQIVSDLDLRMRRLEGGSSPSDPIESPQGETAPQSR